MDSAGPGTLPWDLGETYMGTMLLSTGHQPWISQVLWVSLNTTHWPVFMPGKHKTDSRPEVGDGWTRGY